MQWGDAEVFHPPFSRPLPLPRWEHMAARGEMQAGLFSHTVDARLQGQGPGLQPRQAMGCRGTQGVRSSHLVSPGRNSGILGGSGSFWESRQTLPLPLICLWPQHHLRPAPGWSIFLPHAPPSANWVLLMPPPLGLGPVSQLPQASPTHAPCGLYLLGCSPSLGSRYAECLPVPGLGRVPGVGSVAASSGCQNRHHRPGGLHNISVLSHSS